MIVFGSQGNFSNFKVPQITWRDKVKEISILLKRVFLSEVNSTHSLTLLFCWSHLCAVILATLLRYQDGSSILLLWFQRQACGTIRAILRNCLDIWWVYQRKLHIKVINKTKVWGYVFRSIQKERLALQVQIILWLFRSA